VGDVDYSGSGGHDHHVENAAEEEDDDDYVVTPQPDSYVTERALNACMKSLRVVVELNSGPASDGAEDSTGRPPVSRWEAAYKTGINTFSIVPRCFPAHSERVENVLTYEDYLYLCYKNATDLVEDENCTASPTAMITKSAEFKTCLTEWKRAPLKSSLQWGMAEFHEPQPIIDGGCLIPQTAPPLPLIKTNASTQLTVRLEFIPASTAADQRPVVILQRMVPICNALIAESTAWPVSFNGTQVYTSSGKPLTDKHRMGIIAPEKLPIPIGGSDKTTPSTKGGSPTKESVDGSYVYVVLVARSTPDHKPGTRLRSSREKEVVQVTVALGEKHQAAITEALMEEYCMRSKRFNYCSRNLSTAGVRCRAASTAAFNS